MTEEMPLLHFTAGAAEEVPVNKTFLSYCVDVRGSQVLSALSADGRQALETGQCWLNIAIMGSEADKTPLALQKTSCILQQNGIFRINLPQSLKIPLQRMFWLSSALCLLDREDETELETLRLKNGLEKPKKKGQALQETAKVTVIPHENPLKSGIVLSPCKRMDLTCAPGLAPLEQLRLLRLTEKVMESGAFTLDRPGSAGEKDHVNTIVQASDWKNATEFSAMEKAMKNCIYYLTTEETEGPKAVYAGEAVLLGGRLKTKKVGDVTYIGHQEDLMVNKFTRYRVDRLDPEADPRTLHNAQDALIGGLNLMDRREFPRGFRLTNAAYNKAHGRVNQARKAENARSDGHV
ncbi:MAG: hypothetical protein RSB55_02015 [Oscillospiraceae bacterium]